MNIIEVVWNWSEGEGVRLELPGIPRLGDIIVMDGVFDGTVDAVVWEQGKPVKVTISS